MIFTNPLMGSAAMGRLVHRAIKIVIEGKNYRVDSFVKRTKQAYNKVQSRCFDSEKKGIENEKDN